MKHKLLNYFCLLFLLAFVTGCEEDNKDDFTPKLYKVTGKVEKGPFINGSKITAQALDKDYNLTVRFIRVLLLMMMALLIWERLN